MSFELRMRLIWATGNIIVNATKQPWVESWKLLVVIPQTCQHKFLFKKWLELNSGENDVKCLTMHLIHKSWLTVVAFCFVFISNCRDVGSGEAPLQVFRPCDIPAKCYPRFIWPLQMDSLIKQWKWYIIFSKSMHCAHNDTGQSTGYLSQRVFFMRGASERRLSGQRFCVIHRKKIGLGHSTWRAKRATAVELS